MDAEIIPIQHDPIEGAITALVAARQSHTIEGLARNPGQIDSLLRNYYQRAVQEGVIIAINLAIRTLGSEGTRGAFEWRGRTGKGLEIVAKHDSNSGTTAISVSVQPVLWNAQPGREVLLPGDWLYQLIAAYKQRQQEIEWKVSIESVKTAEQKIVDFTADV